MNYRQQVAAKVAAEKIEHPEKFCPVKKCLYKTGDGSRCPRHREIPIAPMAEIRKRHNEILENLEK